MSADKTVAEAHPNGKSPWGWDDYVGKFDRLTGDRIGGEERDRFIKLAARLSTLHSGEIRTINPSTSVDFVLSDAASGPGIFDFDQPR